MLGGLLLKLAVPTVIFGYCIMSELNRSERVEGRAGSLRENKGVHYETIIKALPAAIKDAPPARLSLLAESSVTKMPEWYLNASEIQRQYLKELFDERWRLQRQVDGPLENLQQDIQAFAKQLFSSLISSNFNSHEDVSTLTLKLYIPDTIIFGINSGASRLRESSLLDAALHNFEEPETAADYFGSGSGVYRKNARGELSLVPVMSISKIATLCRRLDIGAQYQTHIKSILLPADPSARQALEQTAVASEKATFKLDALIAYLKKDISSYAYGILRGIGNNKGEIRFHDRPLHSHRLSLMGFRLRGIVLFSVLSEPSKIEAAIDELTPDALKFWTTWSQRVPALSGNPYEKFKLLQSFFANGPSGVSEEMLRRDGIYKQSHLSGPLIAYIPDDPLHPLKEYDSLADFMKELISQLRQSDYQEFFSRFVAQKDKGRFFARVNERLTRITWQQREPLDMGPWWRESAVENPNAEPITNLISGDLWQGLYREKRDKAISDSRAIAVPTADEDATTRWKRLTSYLDIGWNIFNVGAMLVPGLGEAVLGLMVAQMAAELLEGIEDWSKGDKEEAAAHLNGVLINFAQLALMGAGHVLPRGTLTPIKVSPFVDNLKPIEVNGKERLWNPDLTSYEHSIALPENTQASDLGLYSHEGQEVLRLDDKHYVVTQDSETGQHRLKHPTRPRAYQPVLEHNGAGSWKTELDQPLEWDKIRLLRRLGASADAWSDEALEQMLTVSGVPENALRRLHVEHESPPAMLVDTFKRFKAWADAGEFSRQILANRAPEELEGFIPAFMTELSNWPQSRAVELFEGPGLTGKPVIYGNIDAKSSGNIKLTRAQLRTGQLPQRVIENFSEREIHELLGDGVSSDRQARIEVLQNQLTSQAEMHQKRLFEALYRQRDVSGDPRTALLFNESPQLPSAVADELLLDAEAEDLRYLSEKKRLPLRLREQVRSAQARVRLSRAYEGLYLKPLENGDTLRLELASLATLPGWSPNVRIEIRAFSFSGEMHASIGPEDAPVRKVLIFDGEGRYQARDEQGQHLHGADDFYASILHSLPDNERKALGYDIYEGERLRQAIQRSPVNHERFESVLAEYPIRKPAYDPQTMRLRGGMEGYRQLGDRSMLQTRVSSLYPAFTEEQVSTMLDDFGASADQRVSALEEEFNALNYKFRVWMDSSSLAHRLSPAGMLELRSKELFYRAIRQCWQRTGPAGVDVPGIVSPQMLKLDGLPMNHLANMPKLEANFDHVTSLSLRNCNMLSSHAPFLETFRRLRYLDLGQNLLNRLPPVIGDMRYLEQLVLNENRIELTQQAVAHLRALTRLKSLGLRGNPLRLLPDISQMPALQVLILAETGIDSWPTGLFGQARPRNIYLDLRNNPISRIPEVAPGSFRAELLARTLLSREPQWISAQNLDTLRSYIESVGMDPERPYPPRSTMDSTAWAEGMTEKDWQARQEIWDAIEDEFNSESFFNEIRRLTQSADFRAGGVYREELTAKVWRMLEAMAEDSKLRITLFNEAIERTQCVDGATQLFNVMGIKILIHEAYGLANPALIEAELVSLAKGKTRLDEIERIAERHIAKRLAAGERFRVVDAAGNVTGTIDVVEVHLAFMTDLAERLDLPWQARGMQFRNIAGVTPEMIEDAYQRIQGLEEGHYLRDSIAEEPFWKSYVERSNGARFRRINRKEVAITEFKEALEERAAGSGLSHEARDRLREQIRVLAAELGKSEIDIAPGQLVTSEEYAAELEEIKTERNTLLKDLTQQAMDRARLQRVEIPFTVAPVN